MFWVIVKYMYMYLAEKSEIETSFNLLFQELQAYECQEEQLQDTC